MNLPLTAAPATDPSLIYRYRDCLYADDLLIAAVVELDLFTTLAATPLTPGGICRHWGLAERPVDVMITLFKARGLVAGQSDLCHVTPAAREHLVAGSPWFIGPYYASLKDRPVCRDLLKVLRTGRPANWGSQPDEKDWHRAMETEAFATQFTAAMDCRGVFLAQAMAKVLDLSRHRHVLDIAGGSGIYAASLAAHHPHLAATVLEKPPVDAITRKALLFRGMGERVAVVAGDMFTDPFPAEADVHLYSNVLHDWDVPELRQLLARSAATLRPGGLFVMHDAFLNDAKDGPLHAAEYSVMLMHATQGRCYGTAEMAGWLDEAGFGDFQYRPTAAARGVAWATRRTD